MYEVIGAKLDLGPVLDHSRPPVSRAPAVRRVRIAVSALGSIGRRIALAAGACLRRPTTAPAQNDPGADPPGGCARDGAEGLEPAPPGTNRSTHEIDALCAQAGRLAHDLNNALLPIIGLTELTVAGLPAGSREAADLSKVLQAAYRAMQLAGLVRALGRRA